jgi:hypothetical protein
MNPARSLIALSTLIAALCLPGSVAAKQNTTAPAGNTPAAKAEKPLLARPGLTTAEVDAAVQQAAQLERKMTVPQVEAIVGNLSLGGGGASLDDTLNAMPRLPRMTLTATNGIFRFDFTSDDKGRYRLTTWALLPGATPSQ